MPFFEGSNEQSSWEIFISLFPGKVSYRRFLRYKSSTIKLSSRERSNGIEWHSIDALQYWCHYGIIESGQQRCPVNHRQITMPSTVQRFHGKFHWKFQSETDTRVLSIIHCCNWLTFGHYWTTWTRKLGRTSDLFVWLPVKSLRYPGLFVVSPAKFAFESLACRSRWPSSKLEVLTS